MKILAEPLATQISYTVASVSYKEVGSRKAVKKVNDKYFEIQSSDNAPIPSYLLGLYILGLWLLFVIGFMEKSKTAVESIVAITCLIGGYALLYFLVEAFFSRKYVFWFDRNTGVLAINIQHIFKSRRRKMELPFSSLQFQKRPFPVHKGRYGSEFTERNADFCLRIAIDGEKPFIVVKKEAIAWLSMLVWYMDKNRPLPPGTAFDFYRERDYERRKSEGFLHPLYPSLLETPEWVGAEGGDALKKYRAYVAMLQRRYKSKLDNSRKNYRK